MSDRAIATRSSRRRRRKKATTTTTATTRRTGGCGARARRDALDRPRRRGAARRRTDGRTGGSLRLLASCILNLDRSKPSRVDRVSKCFKAAAGSRPRRRPGARFQLSTVPTDSIRQISTCGCVSTSRKSRQRERTPIHSTTTRRRDDASSRRARRGRRRLVARWIRVRRPRRLRVLGPRRRTPRSSTPPRSGISSKSSVYSRAAKPTSTRETKTQGGSTALVLASQNGRPMVVDALLAAGADVNACNAGGDTPLILASLNGHGAIVDALLRAGANVHATDQFGSCALFYASRQGHCGAARRAHRPRRGT